MQLTERETTLLNAFRRLPDGIADELSALVQRLAALSQTCELTGGLVV